MFYGAAVWDPWLILAQIATLQCLFYLTLGALLALLVGSHAPARFDLALFFDAAALDATTPAGCSAILAFAGTAAAGSGHASEAGAAMALGAPHGNDVHVSAIPHRWPLLRRPLALPLCRAGYLLVIVERAKKCLDFTATTYIIHLALCTAYAGLPATFTWWLVNGLALVFMAVLGEWLCMRRELRDIPLGGSRPRFWPWYVPLQVFDLMPLPRRASKG
eukprot:SM000133S26826  [mRNA]  locus=s133:395880:397073:+ [translate_table: standard]